MPLEHVASTCMLALASHQYLHSMKKCKHLNVVCERWARSTRALYLPYMGGKGIDGIHALVCTRMHRWCNVCMSTHFSVIRVPPLSVCMQRAGYNGACGPALVCAGQVMMWPCISVCVMSGASFWFCKCASGGNISSPLVQVCDDVMRCSYISYTGIVGPVPFLTRVKFDKQSDIRMDRHPPTEGLLLNTHTIQ